jgi:hypothetical protein
MKVTLSAAMRARDVSRPRPEDEEAARLADGAPPAGNARGRAGHTDSADRTDRAGRTENRTENRTGGSDRSVTAKSSAGRRRKRR